MLEQLDPREVFKYFEEITRIPRCSYHEEAISQYLLDFANEHGLWSCRDELNNVIIKKPATSGREHAPTVILQGHTDMVCSKLDGVTHDFSCDPIDLEIVDGWIQAKGTTLGADDGIAIAYILAILASDTIEHGPIEALCTTSEEMSMEGAMAVTSEYLTGQYLFNIDGEVEGELLVGCAGGLTITSHYDVQYDDVVTGECYELSIGQLTGGHSGQEIHKSRANSIKLLARLLQPILPHMKLVSMEGGTKHNAIPTHSCATFVIDDVSQIDKVENMMDILRKEHCISDPELNITLTKLDVLPSRIWTRECTQDVVRYFMAIPEGVQYMDPVFHDLVQTSLSNGIVTYKNDCVELVTLLRSSVKSAEVEIYSRIRLIAEAFGFSVTDDGGYPAWEYAPQSQLRDTAIQVYTAQYKEAPLVKTIHCGLECGILKRVLPNTDMLTFGPDMVDIHTPKERLNIASVERVWYFLLELLKELSSF